VDEAEQGRAAAVLPGQAEEVQAGDIGDAPLVDRSTWRVAASSRAIWNPELPPPTTSTGPGGNVRGLRYPALCS
jgi:hypothetical protein